MADILIVTAEYPFGTGEAFLAPELRELQKRGHRIRLAPIRGSGRRRHGTSDIELVEIGNARVRTSAKHLLTQRRFRRDGGGLLESGYLAWLAARIAAAVDHDRPDVVHGYWGTGAATVARSVGRSVDAPWSFTVHRYELLEETGLTSKLETCAAVRFISHDGRALAVSISGLLPDERWAVIPLGIEIPPPVDRVTAPEPSLLWVGRFAPIKGPEVAVDAMASVLSCMPSSRLVMVGDGPLRAKVERRAGGIDDGSHIQFVGHQRHDSVLELMNDPAMIGIVSTSYHEGVPVVLMEAMARNLPAVAARSGGTPELVEPSDGWLCAPGDAASFATAMCELIQMPLTARSDRGRRARDATIRRHDAKKTAAQFEQLLLGHGP